MTTTTEARPAFATAWETDILDAGAIQDELNKLWATLGGPRHGGQAPGEMVAEERYGGGQFMRANTLNLLAVADTDKHIRLIEETVRNLTDLQPSRTIILITRPTSDTDSNETHFDVRVELLESTTPKGEPSVRFEVVTIRSDGQTSGNLPSLVTPLLVAELSDFLWWPSGTFPRHTLFHDLLGIVDRLIVDSAQLGRDASGIDTLRSLLDYDSGAHLLGDFTWHRLSPWRQLLAQFFDPPNVQPCLDTIEQVSIAYADVRRDGSSGFPAALLTVGWLASRLNWEVIEQLERRRSGGWWAPLRARTGDHGREIELRLTPDTSPHAVFSLRKVQIIAGGDAPGQFTIERTDSDDLITSSESPSMPPVSRMVYARRPTDQRMLGAELQRFGRDRIFEEALALAAKLIP
ncbi:MAG: glucose-6-phosphate dehydrogenase assembly protein OpcA [Chloroflexia bacterium]|nr:glucose-6-phosphate dehydrogenase assembly protein OpcA [Chloroflexia bacterium]